MKVLLPYIGYREVRRDPNDPSHWLYLNPPAFEWSDCTREEDNMIGGLP